MIYVTKPYLPPLEEMMPYLEKIWESGIVSNSGPFHQELETQMCEYLGVDHISLFSNATIALIVAVKALNITGEVITTPFSFVATAHSLLWNNVTPVFVDIDPTSLNMDPTKIESAITSQTTGILPVHVYGHPCDVDEIEKIATKNKLKVIYDAAHSFGVNCHCGSILNHGDLSVVSFHATKVFNTFEGGAIISKNREIKLHIDHLKNFGFVDEITLDQTGINGKMSEFNAALGLVQLKYIDKIINKRKVISDHYESQLAKIEGISCISSTGEMKSNYSYFPILVKNSFPISRDDLYDKLKLNGIHARKYFYPLIPNFPMIHDMYSFGSEPLPVANRVSSEVLCLPIYPDLEINIVDMICSLIEAV